MESNKKDASRNDSKCKTIGSSLPKWLYMHQVSNPDVVMRYLKDKDDSIKQKDAQTEQKLNSTNVTVANG